MNTRPHNVRHTFGQGKETNFFTTLGSLCTQEIKHEKVSQKKKTTEIFEKCRAVRCLTHFINILDAIIVVVAAVFFTLLIRRVVFGAFSVNFGA